MTSGAFVRKSLQKRRFLEKGDGQDLQDFARAPVEVQFLLDDGRGRPTLTVRGMAESFREKGRCVRVG